MAPPRWTEGVSALSALRDANLLRPIQIGRTMASPGLERLTSEIIACRRCPRLVRYREAVARTKRAAFREWTYWGRPVPGFGDPEARLLVVGLAPAAHGGNRTGRAFTGDRCAPPQNKPSRVEFARCQPFLEREIALLPNLRVVVALGAVAMDAFLRAWRALGHDVPTPRPKFRHAGRWSLPPITLVASYHPSQRNTQTGLLNEGMFDRVFRGARDLLESPRRI